jgi:glycosyltransferase involved in cell wall biosynthesis
MKEPMISIVIPTKNSERTLEACLDSIKTQTYQNYELIIVDGFSKDKTRAIAERHTDEIFTSPESLPAARNLGFSKAKGDLFISIDSDMVLEKDVLEEIAGGMSGHGGLIIPEIGYGSDFISKCKDLEKRCYVGDEIIEAARAFSRDAFFAVNGYDPNLLFGEDWDIHLRIKKRFCVGRIKAKVMHNAMNLSLTSNIKKAYRYGKTLPRYLAKNHSQSKKWLTLKRNFFFRHFAKLRREPIYALGLLFIKSMEYVTGFAGFLVAKIDAIRGSNKKL